jgi:uncharacterized protein YcbX
MTTLATIKQIYIYPVKSMRGIPVNEAQLSIHGFLGDRRYAFVQQALAAKDDFPWMTGREKPPMILHTTRFERIPTMEDKDVPVFVRTPEGTEYNVTDPRLCEHVSQLLGHPVFLLKNGRGNYDTQQVGLISLSSVAQLEKESATKIDHRQFRANLYIEPADGVPFVENEWVGRVLKLGEGAQIGITDEDERCMMINLNPDTAKQDPAVLRTVTQKHGQHMGIYANVVAPGLVRVGDKIESQ